MLVLPRLLLRSPLVPLLLKLDLLLLLLHPHCQ
jgi:hypothetical protein